MPLTSCIAPSSCVLVQMLQKQVTAQEKTILAQQQVIQALTDLLAKSNDCLLCSS